MKWQEKPSYLYRNLHTGNWSVRRGGKVVDHVDSAVVHGAEFKVNHGGRERVRREGRKNVHAFVVGNLSVDPDKYDFLPWREAYYNPYKHDAFVDKETGDPIGSARMAKLDKDMKVWYFGPYD